MIRFVRLVTVLILILTVPLKNPLTRTGRLGLISMVQATQCLRLLLEQMTLTVCLFNMQSGCIIMGQLTRRVIPRVLRKSWVTLPGGRPTLSLCRTVLKCLWLLVTLTELGEAF